MRSEASPAADIRNMPPRRLAWRIGGCSCPICQPALPARRRTIASTYVRDKARAVSQPAIEYYRSRHRASTAGLLEAISGSSPL